MAVEANQILRVTDEPIINKSKSDFKMESDIPATSSSSNMATGKMIEKTTPEMIDYWKKTWSPRPIARPIIPLVG
jgi:hypothetical protein